MQPPIELSLHLGPGAHESSNYVYVWLDRLMTPFYVGETSKSPADRTGLHIRDKSRSGAIVSAILQKQKAAPQHLTVLAFAISNDILDAVAKENMASPGVSSSNRSRKAIERAVFVNLKSLYPKMHPGRGCSWNAKSANDFVAHVVTTCQAKRQ